MAKLPEIEQGPRARLTTAQPIGAAVAAAGQNVQLVNQALEGLNKVAQEHREYELNTVNSGYQDYMSKARMKASALKYATPAEIEAMGLSDVVDTEGKTVIPKAEWYPQYLERTMREAQRLYADRIMSPIDQENWLRETKANDQRILEQETLRAIEDTHRHLEQLKEVDADAHMDNADWISARDKATLIRDPARRAAKLDEIGTREADYEDYIFMDTATPEELEARADTLRSKEHAAVDVRGTDQLIIMANKMDNLAKQMRAGDEANFTRQKNEYQARQLRNLNMKANDPTYTMTYKDVMEATKETPYSTPSLVTSAETIWSNYKKSKGDNGYAKTSDMEKLRNLREALEDPTTSQADAIRMYEETSPFLTYTHANEMNTLLTTRTDPIKASGIQSVAQQVDGYLLANDISDEAVVAMYHSAVSQALIRETQVNGEMTDTRRSEVVNQTMQQYKYELRRDWNYDPDYDDALTMIHDQEGGNAPAVMRTLEASMRRAGLPFTQENYAKMYQVYYDNKSKK